jgi:transcriptional regulator with XRE-family HTH domain
LRRTKETKADQEWLKALGKNLRKLIEDAGYESPYDFWVQRAGDHISRATLNYILKGKTDPKAGTLRTIARLLKVKPSHLLEFDDL